MVKEADRLFNHGFAYDSNWSSQGRPFTRGLVMTKGKNGDVDFISQAMIVDVHHV